MPTCAALDAVLASFGSVDAVWHLGDVVGYGPEPDGVVDRLAEIGAVGVRGNHDAAAIGGDEIDWFNPDARAARWSGPATRISPTTRDVAGGAAGAPRRWTTSRSSTAARASRSGSTSCRSRSPARTSRAHDAATGFYGHTHLPIVFAEHDGRVEQIEPRRRLDVRRSTAGGRCSTRAASASRATASRRASYLVLDTDAERVHLAPGRLRHRRGPGGDAPMPACRERLDRTALVRPADRDGRMIGGRRPLQGRKPGDRRVRVERPHAPYFRYTGPGQLTAKEAASAPTTPAGRVGARISGLFSAGRSRPRRRSASGSRRRRRSRSSARTRSARRPTRPRRSSGRSSSSARRGRAGVRPRDQHRDRRPARSSSPSATARSASPTRPAAARTPSRSANFGRIVSLVAASALLIDYVMTVAVSTSSAVEQITSAFPALVDDRGPDRRRRHRPDHHRQPARPARGRQHLRGPDLPVRRLGAC